jgi:hypothetical protein
MRRIQYIVAAMDRKILPGIDPSGRNTAPAAGGPMETAPAAGGPMETAPAAGGPMETPPAAGGPMEDAPGEPSCRSAVGAPIRQAIERMSGVLDISPYFSVGPSP